MTTDEALTRPYLNVHEVANIFHVQPNTVRQWVSNNRRTGMPHNPLFPRPVYRGKLIFRTSDILSYQEDRHNTETFPSP